MPSKFVVDWVATHPGFTYFDALSPSSLSSSKVSSKDSLSLSAFAWSFLAWFNCIYHFNSRLAALCFCCAASCCRVSRSLAKRLIVFLSSKLSFFPASISRAILLSFSFASPFNLSSRPSAFASFFFQVVSNCVALVLSAVMSSPFLRNSLFRF
jgi:hypothetical protein